MLTAMMALTALACDNGNTNKQDESEHDHSETEHSSDHNMEESSSVQLSESSLATVLIDHYLAVKNALVQDDSEKASAAAKELSQSASDFDLSTVEGAGQTELSNILEGIKEKSEQIATGDIEHQREHFEGMANDFLKLLEITGIDRTLYKQYCPMYNDNEGGYWLSESEEIKNPLFGSKMLTCGSVKETISIN